MNAVLSQCVTETAKEAAHRLAAEALREGYKPIALHTYTAEDGSPLYWRLRMKHQDGRKFIRPMRLDTQGFILKEPEFSGDKPLYRLHELAANPQAPVWYVEGELCADRLSGLGVLTTTAGGATSDDKTDLRPLAGRSVVIWPDFDEPGYAQADRVALRLRAMNCNLEIIDSAPLGLPEGGDVIDWLALRQNATRADLALLPRKKESKFSPEKKEKEQWPDPLPEAAYLGLVGDIVLAIEPNTESDPAAILLQVLVSFGALVGRGPHVRVEGDQHHTNLFALLVGDTSKARKGTSWGRVRELFQRVENPPRVVSGLSSGEGLKYAVRDEIIKTVNCKDEVVDQGVTDKRLLVVESEFAQVLRQTARGGNTLSVTVRCAWDAIKLETLTKNDPVTATDPHVCIVGHITQDELRAELTSTDSANGFANRFIFMSVRRSKVLPFGGDEIPEGAMNNLVALADAEAALTCYRDIAYRSGK